MAIAITLLVIEISIPVVGDTDVGAALTDHWEQYLSFVISFVVVGRYWAVHNRMFRYITHVDGMLVFLNFGLLLSIAFLPFPTSVLGDHSGSSAAVVAYAITLCCVAGFSSAIWFYAAKDRRLIDDRLTDEEVHSVRIRGLAVLVTFAVSVPIALADPAIGALSWLLIPLWGKALALLTRDRVRAAS